MVDAPGTARSNVPIVTHPSALAAAQAPFGEDAARYDVNRIVAGIMAERKGN